MQILYYWSATWSRPSKKKIPGLIQTMARDARDWREKRDM